MNKHDYMDLMKAINKHIVEARKITHACANFPEQKKELDDHLEKAKDALWVLADDIGIELINEKQGG